MNVIGIDVSKLKLDCAWLNENNKPKTKVFPNSPTGWSDLLGWAVKDTGLPAPGLHFVMEATGIYHGQVAAYLYGQGAVVSAVARCNSLCGNTLTSLMSSAAPI